MDLLWLVLLSASFPVTHIGLCHGPIRRALVRGLGEWPFRGLYSVISFATLGGAGVYFWSHRHLGPVLWDLPQGAEMAVTGLLMLLALVLVALAMRTPSPASMIPTKIEVRGVLRITRHPMNIGFVLFGLAHMVANGTAGDLVFFGSFVVLGLIGPLHMEQRKAAELGEPFREFLQSTSLLPFVAVVRGRTRIAWGELRWGAVLVGVLLWAVLALLHGRLIGGDVLPF